MAMASYKRKCLFGGLQFKWVSSGVPWQQTGSHGTGELANNCKHPDPKVEIRERGLNVETSKP